MNEPFQVKPATVSPQYATYTYDLGIHGIFTFDFHVPGVTPSSVVMVSMAELSRSSPFVGDAVMTVHGVAPGNDVVRVKGEVSWDSDLSTRLYFLVA